MRMMRMTTRMMRRMTMSKPMDYQAAKLIVMMNLHLTHEYGTEEAKQKNLDTHIKEFKHYDSLPVTQFSSDVWDKMNDLFESYR